MTDVLCLNLPFMPYYSRPSRSSCVTRGGTLYYPMSLLTMTSYALGKGFDAKVMDLVADFKPDWKESVKKLSPKIILIDTSTPSIMNDIKYADEIQKENPNSKVILVGRHVTHAPSESLGFCNSVNTVARGEFFVPIREILEGKEYQKVHGMSHKEEDGKIKHNPNAELVKDVEEFGILAKVIKDQLNVDNYFYASLRNPYIMLQTAWGCPYNCRFCNEVVKHMWRHRTVESVISELKFLDAELPRVREIYWDDPTFVVDEKFTQDLCNAIIENKIKVKWSCVTRANISTETLKLMKAANGRTMHIGLESTNQESLNNVNKGMSFSDEVEYLKRCEKIGIMNHACFIFGLPGDTNESIRESINVIKRLPSLDSIQIFPLIPIPFENIFGKEAENTTWEYLVKNNYLATRDYSKWLKPDGTYNCVVSYPNLSNEQIEKWVETGYNEFYFRPSYVLHKLRQSLLSWEDMKRNARSFKIMMQRKKK
jgi:anaerobic magnesium-protoporphyrin IX monomethyl ester cyclase